MRLRAIEVAYSIEIQNKEDIAQLTATSYSHSEVKLHLDE